MEETLSKQKIADILYSHIKQMMGLCYISQNDIPDIAEELLTELKLQPVTAKIEQENYGITDKIIEEAMNVNTPFFGNSGAKVPTVEQMPSESAEGSIAESIYHIFKNTERIHGKSEALDWIKIASYKSAEYLRHKYASQKHLPTDEEIGAKKNELFSQWKNPYTDDELNHNDNMERYRKGFDAAIEWLRDKLNNKEK